MSLLTICIFCLEKCLIGSTTHFLNQNVCLLMLFYELFVYLDINPLLVISLANTFSLSVGCLFILSMVSIVMQKLLSLIRFHLFIFALFPLLKEMDIKIVIQFMLRIVFCLSSPVRVLLYLVLHLCL